MRSVAVLLACGSAGCTTSRAPTPDAAASGGAISESELRSPRFAARPYHVDFASGRDVTKPAPVLLLLHGFGGDGKNLEQYFHLRPLAAAHDALIVRVDGTQNPDGARFWNAGDTCCDLYGQAPDDVGYLDAVLDDIAAHFPVDAKRVYLVGHSNGGFMAYRYACERAGRVAAIVSLAGAGSADIEACRPSEPVAVLQVHGDADEMVPYAGGSLSSPERLATLKAHDLPLPQAGVHTGAFSGARATVDAWAARDGCSKDEFSSGAALDLDARLPGEETVRVRHEGCKGGAAELWTMRGGGHLPRLSGAWSEAIYGFLRDHPKR